MTQSAADRARIVPPVLPDRLRDRTTPTVEAGYPNSVHGPSAIADSVDRMLIGQLLENCRATNRELAHSAGISESAVSIRLKKLMSVGSLVFTALIDWEMAGFEWFVIARIRTQGAPTQVAERVGQLENCEAAAVVLGSYDIVAYFLVHDREELHSLVNDELPAIDGIGEIALDLSSETAITDHGRQFFMARNVPPIRLPAPRIDVDELDVQIMQALVSDSRQSSRAIGRDLGVAEGTIRTRMNRLDATGLCRVVAMAEPISLGLAGIVATIAMSVDRTKLKSIQETATAIPETVFFATTVGSADVVLTVTANDNQHLVELVADRIRSIPGVLTTDTLPMVNVVRFSPYMKRLP